MAPPLATLALAVPTLPLMGQMGPSRWPPRPPRLEPPRSRRGDAAPRPLRPVLQPALLLVQPPLGPLQWPPRPPQPMQLQMQTIPHPLSSWPVERRL